MGKEEKFIQPQKPDYLGHRARLRERYKKTDFETWPDYEILELILTYAIPRRDTKSIAKRLVKRFKNLSGVLDASREDLKEIKGVGENASILLNLFKPISAIYLKENLYKRNLLSSPQAVYEYLRASLKGSKDEEFKVIFLNNRNEPMAIEKIHEGTVNKSVVYPRKIVEGALKHKATSVIFAHNHPGGSLKPSFEDQEVTRKLITALKTVDIEVLDHIIISSQGYLSFKEEKII